jgi:Flp pilus assembly protein CpaB
MKRSAWKWLLFTAVCGVVVLSAPGLLRADAAEVVPVLVARRDIPPGPIKEPEKWFKLVRYLKGDEPTGAVGDFEQLKGKVLTRDLGEDQPVKQKDLRAIPPGMQAFVLRVQVDGMVVRLLDARVDVVLTVRLWEDTTRSGIILQNVLILAENSYCRATPDVVTLAVTPQQANRLFLAQEVGWCALMLSNPDQK